MPVTSKIGCIGGNRDTVTHSDGDLLVAAGTQVRLGGFVGLHAAQLDCTKRAAPDVAHPKNAQATSATAAATAASTKTMSVRRFTRFRVASNPTASLCIVGS